MGKLPERYGFLGVGVVITALLVSASALDEPYPSRQLRSDWRDASAAQSSLTEIPHNMVTLGRPRGDLPKTSKTGIDPRHTGYHEAAGVRYRVYKDAQRLGCNSINPD